MKSLNVTLMLVVMFFFSNNQVSEAESKATDWLAEKTHVDMSNELGDGIDLLIHCKSKDDDLGEHHIGFKQEYEWSFHVNLFDSTLFWCSLGWQNSSGQWVSGSFDIYKGQRDESRCAKRCHWKIIPNGLYSYNTELKYWENLFIWPH